MPLNGGIEEAKATLWVKAQHEGALPPPCIVRKDPRVQVILIPDHLEEVQMPRRDGGIEEVDMTARSALGEGYSPCKPLK